MKRKIPDLFIVGAPKCGTTSMADYLGSHPAIFMARKEMHHFGSDLRFAAQFYRRNLDAYLAEFDAWSGQRYAAEASVWYLFSTQAAAEIKALSPEARILIMLREPSEMLHSLYYQFRFDGNEHLPTFAEALEAEEDRRAGRRLGSQTYLAQGLVYHDVARYTDQVRRYFDTFGRERVRVILYEDFAANVARCYLDTLEFLGVDPARAPKDFKVVNPAKRVRSPALKRLLGAPCLRAAAVGLLPWMPRRLLSLLQRLDARLRRANTRYEKRPPLPPDLRTRLKREFAPEVQRLGQLLGCNLAHWSKPDDAGGSGSSIPVWLPNDVGSGNCILHEN